MYPGRFTCWRVIVQWTVDPVPGDVLEDAIVGGRRPPRVVLGLEAVDGDDDRSGVECRATRSASRAPRS